MNSAGNVLLLLLIVVSQAASKLKILKENMSMPTKLSTRLSIVYSTKVVPFVCMQGTVDSGSEKCSRRIRKRDLSQEAPPLDNVDESLQYLSSSINDRKDNKLSKGNENVKIIYETVTVTSVDRATTLTVSTHCDGAYPIPRC